MDNIIGIDIGGTKCSVALGSAGEYSKDEFNKEIKILDKEIFQTEVQKDADYTLNCIASDITEVLKRNNKKIDDICSIGISCGGPLDSEKGIILSPPNLYGWDNIHIVEFFQERLGIKTKLQNDANACALAEWKFGAARGCSNVVFLTFGTGMGAGLILNGRLYSGTNDMAGEIGHVRLAETGPVGYGKAGSIEGFCSGQGIAQLARTKVLEKLQMGIKVPFCESVDKLDELNAKVIANEAEKGNELAKEIYETSGRYLGKALSILIDILNPEIIVIGSIFFRNQKLLWPAAFEVIKEEALSLSRNVCKIVPAELGENIGDYASLAVALYE